MRVKKRLYLIGESYYLQNFDGEISRITRTTARHFLLNFTDPQYSSGFDKPDKDIHLYDGDVIAELVKGCCLLVHNPIHFRTLVENTNVKYISVSEYAKSHGKSSSMVRRLCQNEKMSGAIYTPGGYIIPEDAPYPT